MRLVVLLRCINDWVRGCEKVYSECLKVKLQFQGITFECEKEIL